jgi:hypothetical protein
VTSRPILDIERGFEGCISQKILASDEDIQRYLDSHMSQLPAFVLRTPKLQDEIKTEITRASEGMYVPYSTISQRKVHLLITTRFLLAQLYFASLEDKPTPKASKMCNKAVPEATPRG